MLLILPLQQPKSQSNAPDLMSRHFSIGHCITFTPYLERQTERTTNFSYVFNGDHSRIKMNKKNRLKFVPIERCMNRTLSIFISFFFFGTKTNKTHEKKEDGRLVYCLK